MCGYSSQTSFIRAFKERFFMTPKVWRRGGYRNYSDTILQSSPTASSSTLSFEDLKVKIVKTKATKLYYIRHRGYSPKVKEVWQKLQTWLFTNGIETYQSFGIYHDNPIVTPLKECFYVAAIEVEETCNLSNTSLPSFTIPAGIYATFKVEGKYGDILKLIQWAYHEWLPNSGYETTTSPSYTRFIKNHFLRDDERFEVVYYLPVRLG